METQIIQIQNTKYTKYSIYKKQNIQKIEFGNTKDGKTEYTKNEIWKHKRWKYFHKLSPSYLWGLLHKAPGENPH